MKNLNDGVRASQQLLNNGAETDEILTALRRRGYTIVESIEILVDCGVYDLREAKEVVHRSETGPDLRDSHDRFHSDLEAAWKRSQES
jgi:hypothetical protein